MWVVPLVRRESGHNKQGEADKDIRSQHVSKLMMKSYFAKVSLKKDQNNIGDFAKNGKTHSQISTARGFMKLNRRVGFPLGI